MDNRVIECSDDDCLDILKTRLGFACYDLNEPYSLYKVGYKLRDEYISKCSERHGAKATLASLATITNSVSSNHDHQVFDTERPLSVKIEGVDEAVISPLVSYDKLILSGLEISEQLAINLKMIIPDTFKIKSCEGSPLEISAVNKIKVRDSSFGTLTASAPKMDLHLADETYLYLYGLLELKVNGGWLLDYNEDISKMELFESTIGTGERDQRGILTNSPSTGVYTLYNLEHIELTRCILNDEILLPNVKTVRLTNVTGLGKLVLLNRPDILEVDHRSLQIIINHGERHPPSTTSYYDI